MTQQITELLALYPETSSIVFPEQLAGRVDPNAFNVPMTYHSEWFVTLLRADGSIVGRWTLLEN